MESLCCAPISQLRQMSISVSKIKAVIFDMDGVLIDAKEWHFDALNRALGLFGFTVDRYDHLFTYDGLPTRRKLAMLTKEHGLPDALHDMISDLKQIYTMELVYAKCRPIFQHEHAVSRLKSDGFKLGVASNSIRNTVEVMMSRSGLLPYLDVLLSNEDVSHAKPDPEIYVKAMKRLGVSPKQTLIVEDNEHGIKAAEAAGAHVMRVASVHEVEYGRIREALSKFEAGL